MAGDFKKSPGGTYPPGEILKADVLFEKYMCFHITQMCFLKADVLLNKTHVLCKLTHVLTPG